MKKENFWVAIVNLNNSFSGEIENVIKIESKKVKIPGILDFNFYIRKAETLSDKTKYDKILVCEIRSGRVAGFGKNKKEAIQKTIENFNRIETHIMMLRVCKLEKKLQKFIKERGIQ